MHDAGAEPSPGGVFMEIVLALIVGAAVACVVYIIGRMFVGSEGAPDKLSVSAGANIIAESEAARGDQ